MKFSMLAILGVAAATTTATVATTDNLVDGVYLTTTTSGTPQYELVNTTDPVAAAPQIRGRGLLNARVDRSFACSGVNLNDNDLYHAMHNLAAVFKNGYTLTNPSISSVYGTVKVFVCNYNGNAGSAWTSSKVWGKNTEVDGNCGKDIAGHINEPKGEGNFGRTFATDHFC
ncbi:hypothetical protein N0V90_007879 [Kalmusia sp. IMI 367209]|nr:hypothetical protein N0V90_007879 [Kalmusia sp. IMI 367209]